MENKMNEAVKKTKRKSILPYRIDYTEEEIVITKKFAKEAGDMSRNAYKTMKKLREDFPTFKIVTKEIRKKENKRSYAHLTIERMEDIINKFDSDEQTGMREFERLKALTLLLHDERNGLERVLLHFSHFEKETQKLDERLYRITLRYDQDDETELLIRVLSFGPVLEVVAPITFRQLMRNRIQKQALYAARGFSQ